MTTFDPAPTIRAISAVGAALQAVQRFGRDLDAVSFDARPVVVGGQSSTTWYPGAVSPGTLSALGSARRHYADFERDALPPLRTFGAEIGQGEMAREVEDLGRGAEPGFMSLVLLRRIVEQVERLQGLLAQARSAADRYQGERAGDAQVLTDGDDALTTAIGRVNARWAQIYGANQGGGGGGFFGGLVHDVTSAFVEESGLSGAALGDIKSIAGEMIERLSEADGEIRRSIAAEAELSGAIGELQDAIAGLHAGLQTLSGEARRAEDPSGPAVLEKIAIADLVGYWKDVAARATSLGFGDGAA